MVDIDLNTNSISVEVSDEELERRRAEWKPIVHEVPRGLLRRYVKSVGPAKDGALFNR